MNAKGLEDAINRTFGEPPIHMYKEGHPLCTMGIISEDALGYKVSEEDLAILRPFLNARREETIVFPGGNKFSRIGTVLLVARITIDDQTFIKVEDGRMCTHECIRAYLLDIVKATGLVRRNL